MPSWKRVVVSGSSAHLNQVTAAGFYSKDTPWADIRAYGASPNESAANNVTYIQNAINSLPSDGGTVFFPRGTYELNDSLWVSSSNVTFHSDSAILECNHTSPGIMISQSSADSRPSYFYTEGQLRITRDRSSYPLGTQDGSKGIHLSNTTYSHLRGFHISYFNYGLYLEGSGSGVAYNTFEPVGMVDNLVQVKFANSSSAGTVGWVNQNTLSGGQWFYSSLYNISPGGTVPPSSGSFVDMTINVDAQKQNNGNNFMHMSMECSPTITTERWAPAVKCYGTRNVFFSCRSENTNGWDFNHISSSFNTVMYGRFVSASTAGQDIFSTYPHDWGVSQKAHNNFIGVPKSSGASDTVDRQGIFENVGIGTFDPDYPLHVSGSPATIKIEGGSGSPSWKARLLIDRIQGDRGGGIWIEDSTGDESKYWIGAPYNGGSNSGGISIGYHGSQPEYIANSLVFVDNTGKFGIGTTSTGAKLDVYHNADNEWTGLFTQDHATGYGVKITGDMTGTDPLFKIMSENSEPTIFRVQGDGKVGIGTNAPSVLLHVKGDTDTSNVVWGWIQNANTGTSADVGLALTGGGNNFNIGVDATTDSFVINDSGAGALGSNQRFVIDTAGDITASGDIVAGGDVVAYYTSDIKLKDNVEVIQGSLNKIEGIRGVEFDWNDKAPVWAKERGHDVGVIAQEVQKVLPEIVVERKSGYLGVDYKRLVPLLIESVKELKQEVEILKKKVN